MASCVLCTLTSSAIDMQVGFYGGFKYTMCGVNTHQEHSDGTCSLCESGKKSEGKDAVSCDSCKFWYLGSTGHCEVPVFGIILATSIPLTFALIIGLVLRVWHAQHTLAKRMISEVCQSMSGIHI